MTDVPLEQRVLWFAGRLQPDRKEPVTPDLVLTRDLGLTGEGARTFFEKFAKEFEVELEPLWRNWPRHFPKQGSGRRAVIRAALAFLLAGLAVERYLEPRLPFAATAGLLLLLWLGPLRRWPMAKQRLAEPITVADLIAAAEARRWVKPYPVFGLE